MPFHNEKQIQIGQDRSIANCENVVFVESLQVGWVALKMLKIYNLVGSSHTRDPEEWIVIELLRIRPHGGRDREMDTDRVSDTHSFVLLPVPVCRNSLNSSLIKSR